MWWRFTLVGSILLTAFDAFLLQQKKSFFTGGFLSVDHASGPAQAVVFLMGSCVADAAVVGAGVAIALWLLSRIPLTWTARLLAVLALGLGPLIAYNVLEYRLTAYLGDALDLSLMFDLTGRQPSEMLAIAAPHLVRPAVAIVGLSVVAGGIVWAANRLRSSRPSVTRVPVRLFAMSAVFLLAAALGSAALRAYSDVMDNGLRRKPAGKVLGWIVGATTDLDRDGYGLGHYIPDPAPFDASIYPFAIDVPGNGIDENAVGGDHPAGGEPYVEALTVPGPWRHRPDVVLFVLESFRADSIGAVVDGTPVTPVLTSLASSGVMASAGYSHNGYTSQSRYHLMSGSLADLRGDRTLIDDFRANGYEVAYFSGQDESFGGLPVGFDRADVAYDARQDRARRYTTFTTPGSLAVPFQVVYERIDAFLRARTGDRPLFLYVNFHDTHYPYHHAGLRPIVSGMVLPESRIAPSRAQDLRRMYLNTVANVDAAIGSTLDTLRSHLGSPPAIVVTADHGESLFDEGFLGHGYALNDVQTLIPVIVCGLPLVLEQPFGQSELRDAIASALAAPEAATAPRLADRADKRVFQYLGSIERPRQIAFARANTRLIYDFRRREVHLTGGDWVRPDGLDPDGHEQFLELVHLWERIMLARSVAKREATR